MKKRKKTKKVKLKKIKGISDNQIDHLDEWISYYEENKKLPYNKIICNNCKISFVNLKGIAMAHAKKKFDNNINRILTESICKECKNILFPKEKKTYVPKVLTREQMEDRAEEIRRNLPKIDLNKVRERIDMVKNKEVCQQVTSFACWRPDVYLDLGCSECALVKNCACPIKDVKRVGDGRSGLKRKRI